MRIDVSLTVSPIKDPILGVTGASIVVRNITSEKRRRIAQEFLARAAAALEASLDLDEIARTIVQRAVPDLAELCMIDFLEADGTIGRATVAAADPQIAAELEAIRREYPLELDGEHPVARVLQTGKPLVLHNLKEPSVQDEVAQSDAHREFMARADYNSAVVAPMFARGRLVGALSFLHIANDRRFDQDDLELIEDLAARSAMALDNARLYADRDRIAMVLQRGLRPDEPQPIPGLELSVVFEAAGEGVELGGDFYDVIPVGDTHYVLVGDVAGHGAEVAAYTAQIRHTVRALARFGTDPADIVERVNAVLLETDTGERFATLQLARIETRESGAIDVELASAAHPPAVLVRGEGAAETLSGGAIVGVLAADGRRRPPLHRWSRPRRFSSTPTAGWRRAPSMSTARPRSSRRSSPQSPTTISARCSSACGPMPSPGGSRAPRRPRAAGPASNRFPGARRGLSITPAAAAQRHLAAAVLPEFRSMALPALSRLYRRLRPALPVRLPHDRAAERVRDHGCDPRPLQLLLQRLGV